MQYAIPLKYVIGETHIELTYIHIVSSANTNQKIQNAKSWYDTWSRANDARDYCT